MIDLKAIEKNVVKNSSTKICPVCHQSFTFKSAKKVYCSDKCQCKDWKRKHPEKTRRSIQKYYQSHKEEIKQRVKKWYWLHRDQSLAKGKLCKEKKRYGRPRAEILQRDGYKCQICGKNKSLVVHHIDGQGTMVSEQNRNNDPDNLITLCSICHWYLSERQSQNKSIDDIRKELHKLLDLYKLWKTLKK